MRTIVTGIVVFILWSALCTWYYVTHIRGPVAEETPAVEQTAAEMTPTEPDSMATEPEIRAESPGSFTVHHSFDRSTILPDPAFDRYVEQMLTFEAKNPDMKINLVGHTDDIGSEDYNTRLGLRRAQNTRDYLVNKGIPDRIITVASRGESDPVASNETDTGRAQNRRTDIEIID